MLARVITYIKLQYSVVFLIMLCVYMFVLYRILLTVFSNRDVKLYEYMAGNSVGKKKFPQVLFSNKIQKEYSSSNSVEKLKIHQVLFLKKTQSGYTSSNSVEKVKFHQVLFSNKTHNKTTPRIVEHTTKTLFKSKHKGFNDLNRTVSQTNTSHWITVDKERTVFTFSAYFDNISQPIIRILGISLNNRTQPQVICKISESKKDNKISKTYSRTATIQSLPEDKGRQYLGIFILCQLQLKDRPTKVAIKLKNDTAPGHLLYIPIMYPDTNNDDFRVCFPAITAKYSNSYELIQTVEMARIFGSKKFFIYNHGATPEIEKILNLYQKQRVFEVISWKLPVSDIHYFAQIVAINDCLYRNIRTKYVLFMDLDEMLVPKKHNTWTQMMTVLDKPNYSNATFYFQSCFFQKSWEDVYEKLDSIKVDGLNATVLVKKYKIQLLSKIFREKNLQRLRYRSKFIVRPEKVKTVGIHVVFEFRGRPKFNYVNPEIAFLHHYRTWKYTKQRIQDLSLHRFTKPLIKRVYGTWKLLNKT